MDNRITGMDFQTQLDLEGLPRHLVLASTGILTYSMLSGDRILIVDTTNAGGDGVAIVTLPSLAEAVGKFFYICAPVGATGGDLSLYEKETGSELATYGDMDADDDHVLLFSTGKEWRIIIDGVA